MKIVKNYIARLVIKYGIKEYGRKEYTAKNAELKNANFSNALEVKYSEKSSIMCVGGVP